MQSDSNNNQSNPHLSGASGGRGFSVPEREATQRILRDNIDKIYQQNTTNQAVQQAQEEQNPYNRTHQQITDLQKYHTAWQSYYQQYYQRYYMHQAYQQRQKQALEAAAEAAAPNNFEGHQAESRKSQVEQLKADLIDKVSEQAKKARKSNHFLPIISALAVALIFIFLQYNRLWFAGIEAYISPGSTINQSDSILIDPSVSANVGPEPKLIIPKINVDVPVVYDVGSLEDKPVQAALTRGVVSYRLPGADSLPGQVGNTVILGHSSNDVFDPGNFKFAFVLLDKLDSGDLFYIHYQGQRYIYKVTGKKVIEPNQLSELQINKSKPIATLVTCTPAGTAKQRLLVFADQISPDPAVAKAAAPSSTAQNPASIPGNSPTLIDNVLHLFQWTILLFILKNSLASKKQYYSVCRD